MFTPEQKARRNETTKRWAKAHPERIREIAKRYREKNKARVRDWCRSWRARTPGYQTKYMKAQLGRVCKFCGRSDADRLFTGCNQCNTCHNRKRRNGACRKCGDPLYRRRLGAHEWGACYCKTCEEVAEETRAIEAAFTPEQARLAKSTLAGRVLMLWEILENFDSDRVTRSEAMGRLGVRRSSWDVIWRRLVMWASKLPGQMAVYAVEPMNGARTGVLALKRSRLIRFFEPLVRWFAWRGIGRREAPAALNARRGGRSGGPA